MNVGLPLLQRLCGHEDFLVNKMQAIIGLRTITACKINVSRVRSKKLDDGYRTKGTRCCVLFEHFYVTQQLHVGIQEAKLSLG